jgi:hypothetical protein
VKKNWKITGGVAEVELGKEFQAGKWPSFLALAVKSHSIRISSSTTDFFRRWHSVKLYVESTSPIPPNILGVSHSGRPWQSRTPETPCVGGEPKIPDFAKIHTFSELIHMYLFCET